jgi:hypothetical protein
MQRPPTDSNLSAGQSQIFPLGGEGWRGVAKITMNYPFPEA